MSQRRNKSRPHDSDDDNSGDEEFEPTQSQAQGYSSSDIDELARQVCNLLLVGEMRKIPVKSAIIRKFIVQKKNRSSYQSVMDKAGEVMKHVFGFKIVAVHGSAYILTNTMSDKLVKYRGMSQMMSAKWGVLIATLIAIFMSEGKMSAGALESYLRILEIDINTREKPLFQEFLKKKYLETSVEESTDPPTTMYVWGERSHATFSKEDILKFACQVYGNGMKPSMWTQQYKLTKQNEAEEENHSSPPRRSRS